MREYVLCIHTYTVLLSVCPARMFVERLVLAPPRTRRDQCVARWIGFLLWRHRGRLSILVDQACGWNLR